MTTLQPGQSIKPVVSLNQAKKLVRLHFGFEQVVKIKELNSYDDKNFYMEISDRGNIEKFNLKVLNSMDTLKSDHVESEHEMMFHLSRHGINCPIPEKTLDGETFKVAHIPHEDIENANIPSSEGTAEGPKHLIRLLKFVEGTILNSVPINANLLVKAGAYIANVQQLLKDCKCPKLRSYKTIWMLGCVMDLNKFIYAIEDNPDRYNMVKNVLASYKTNVEPLIPKLPQGVIHGDFNEQNILVRPVANSKDEYDINGLIDFGDSSFSPYVFELAITICYMMLESERCGIVDTFDTAGHVVAGYSKIRKVPEVELKMLRTLVACRLSQSLVMGAYTYTLDPGNDYILTTSLRGWKLLDQVWNQTTDEQFFNICKKFID